MYQSRDSVSLLIVGIGLVIAVTAFIVFTTWLSHGIHSYPAFVGLIGSVAILVKLIIALASDHKRGK
jgi:hypothetical protein